MSAPAAVCPNCQAPLPPQISNSAVSQVVTCQSCQSMLLWGAGRVLRAIRPGDRNGPSSKPPVPTADRPQTPPLREESRGATITPLRPLSSRPSPLRVAVGKADMGDEFAAREVTYPGTLRPTEVDSGWAIEDAEDPDTMDDAGAAGSQPPLSERTRTLPSMPALGAPPISFPTVEGLQEAAELQSGELVTLDDTGPLDQAAAQANAAAATRTEPEVAAAAPPPPREVHRTAPPPPPVRGSSHTISASEIPAVAPRALTPPAQPSAAIPDSALETVSSENDSLETAATLEDPPRATNPFNVVPPNDNADAELAESLKPSRRRGVWLVAIAGAVVLLLVALLFTHNSGSQTATATIQDAGAPLLAAKTEPAPPRSEKNEWDVGKAAPPRQQVAIAPPEPTPPPPPRATTADKVAATAAVVAANKQDRAAEKQAAAEQKLAAKKAAEEAQRAAADQKAQDKRDAAEAKLQAARERAEEHKAAAEERAERHKEELAEKREAAAQRKAAAQAASARRKQPKSKRAAGGKRGAAFAARGKHKAHGGLAAKRHGGAAAKLAKRRAAAAAKLEKRRAIAAARMEKRRAAIEARAAAAAAPQNAPGVVVDYDAQAQGSAPAAGGRKRGRRGRGGAAPVVAAANPPPPAPTDAAPGLTDADKTAQAEADAVSKARASYHQGNVKLFTGDNPSAETAYRQSLVDFPGYVAGYRGLGLVLAREGKPADAIEAWSKYLQLAPRARDAWLVKRRMDRVRKQSPGMTSSPSAAAAPATAPATPAAAPATAPAAPAPATPASP